MVLAEPYKIKMVEPIKLLDAKGRKKAIEEAGYNTFLLRSDDVYVDLLTDSGTGAMSDNQWAGIMLGDEAYAGSRNFYAMEKAVKEVLGYEYTVPTHQGRGAEHLLYKTMTKPGDVVPRNMYFTTSRQHVELPGGLMVDAIIDEAHDPDNNHPFKGNMDIKKLQGYVDKYGKEKIPFINVELNVNMAGGQPVSLQNLREVKKFADEYKIPVVLDATRLSENAFFIKEREKEFKDLTITQIIHEMTKCSDSCVYSAKKDCIVNIGGFVATHNKEIFEKVRSIVVIYEGLHTYGGMAGRDMEALARGLREGVDYDYLKFRVSQTAYLGQLLLDAGIPIVNPIGSHAVYLNALKFFPKMARENWPSQTLAAAIYEDSGVRTMERGAVSKGRDANGNNIFPKLELVRMTIPRRVYTNLHMQHAAESVINVYKNRENMPGLEMVYEPPQLRFFQARFKSAKI